MAVKAETQNKNVELTDHKKNTNNDNEEPVKTKCLGRTGSGWLQIVCFFFVYYVCVLSFFLGMLSVYFSQEDRLGPKYQSENGFLGTPGMNFRPRPKEGSLIYFTRDRTTYSSYVHSLQTIMDEYHDSDESFKESNDSAGFWKDCSANSHADVSRGCKFYGTSLSSTNCSKDNDYGFKEAQPCILLRLNKVYGWKPDPYKSNDVMDSSMSTSLVKNIRNSQASNGTGDLIWVECYGRTSVDKEILQSNVKYYPYEGWPVYYFPYMNQFKYIQPAIWVKFELLKPYIGTFVICRAWAKNISPNVHDSVGSVSFEILYEL